MKTTHKRPVVRRAGERGNALIEFSLMATVLFLMTLGVVDLGRVFTAGSKAFSAAAAGTHYGSLSPAHYTNLASIEAAAMDDLGNIAGATATATRVCRCWSYGPAVACPADCSYGYPQTYVQVDVNVPFTTLTGVGWLPAVNSVNGKAIVRVE